MIPANKVPSPMNPTTAVITNKNANESLVLEALLLTKIPC